MRMTVDDDGYASDTHGNQDHMRNHLPVHLHVRSTILRARTAFAPRCAVSVTTPADKLLLSRSFSPPLFLLFSLSQSVCLAV